MPAGQSHISVSGINRRKNGQKQKHCKSKNQYRFPCRIGGRRSAEIAAFLLLSNNKDPSRKKFFKGSSEKIFLLTRLRNKTQRFGDTCELLPEIFQKI